MDAGEATQEQIDFIKLVFMLVDLKSGTDFCISDGIILEHRNDCVANWFRFGCFSIARFRSRCCSFLKRWTTPPGNLRGLRNSNAWFRNGAALATGQSDFPLYCALGNTGLDKLIHNLLAGTQTVGIRTSQR